MKSRNNYIAGVVIATASSIISPNYSHGKELNDDVQMSAKKVESAIHKAMARSSLIHDQSLLKIAGIQIYDSSDDRKGDSSVHDISTGGSGSGSGSHSSR